MPGLKHFTKRLWMRTLFVALATACLAAPVSAQSAPKAAISCKLDLEYDPLPKVPPADTDGTQVQTPVVEFSIGEDGKVVKAKLLRSSNVRIWDRAVLKSVKTWLFVEGKGCGVRTATIAVEIDPIS